MISSFDLIYCSSIIHQLLSYVHISPFSFRSTFALPKTELFSFSVHITSFLDRNVYLSTSVHICPQKPICLMTPYILALLVAFSNFSVFAVHTIELRFV